MRTLRALTLLIILSTLASSCSGGGGLLDYRAEKCTFDLVFEADTGDGGVRLVRWNAEKNGENFTLSLAGDGGDAVVVIEYDGENVYLIADDYIPNEYAPAGKNGKEVNTSISANDYWRFCNGRYCS